MVCNVIIWILQTTIEKLFLYLILYLSASSIKAALAATFTNDLQIEEAHKIQDSGFENAVRESWKW